MRYFTSDTHFGHANIIKYSNRPFKDAAEMDEALVRNWNSVVRPSDEVWHLGDFGFAREDRLDGIIRRLNGWKGLLYGNHDRTIQKSKKLQALFQWIGTYKELWEDDPELKHGRRKLCLFHYPVVSWNMMRHGSFMLHGHCHHNLRYPFKGRILDVGTDGKGFNYSPISYPQIHARLKDAPQEYLDHHAPDGKEHTDEEM